MVFRLSWKRSPELFVARSGLTFARASAFWVVADIGQGSGVLRVGREARFGCALQVALVCAKSSEKAKVDTSSSRD